MIGTIILLVITIVLSAFFSGAEVALLSISEIKARHFVEEKLRNSKALLQLKQEPNKMLITILIGNNLANIGGSALATQLAIELFASAGVGIATGVMTLIILTFGEITPKSFSTKNAKKISLFIAPIILFLRRILSPAVWIFDQFSRLLTAKNQEPLITEQELAHMVAVGEEVGEIKPDEKEMIQRIFRFDDTKVSDIMTPRTDMFALDWNQKIGSVMDDVLKQDYSRIPLYEKNVDKVKGILLVKDLIGCSSKDDLLKDLKREVMFVPENKKLDKLLRELQKKKSHMAIVVNEHGGVRGLVTMEDIIEQIVGEIFDESDDVEHLIRPRGQNAWTILGKTHIAAINSELQLELPESDEYNTLGGLIQHELGRVPHEGDACRVNALIAITVKKTEGPVILEVDVRKVT